jgi:Ni/Co efflux regulator RcnB
MRTMVMATAVLALTAGGDADAQRMVRQGPGVGTTTTVTAAPSRWGSSVDGRWWGGANAPGGWRAYRRPTRGWALPNYWIAPRFYVTDWQAYGLRQPANGYSWTRYYDDAVLIDSRGSVYDSISGIDWNRGDDAYYATDDAVYAGSGQRGGYADHGYDGQDDRRRSSGVGGAVAGAIVGGVAGNVIAGRGNRLGGALIGAGVGASAGYAIDRSQDRSHRAPPPPAYGDNPAYDAPGYGAGYEPPVAPRHAPRPPVAYAPPPPPPMAYHQPMPHRGSGWASSDGGTTVTTTTGYVAGGYYYPAGSTTTVLIQSAPIVTTTTTAIYQDEVTYVRPAVHKVYRKRVWKPRRAPLCGCRY